jgi:lipopolysaccharide/colanic/teichoic acid biosynthesis glycosyltransferase
MAVMYIFFKRVFDFSFAFIALIILSPIFILTSIVLLITGEHEVFYFQERVGYKGKPFRIWKFSTMLKNSETKGNGLITLRDDPRVTTVGKFLRAAKINELPQIINVLIGNMSIVGPRPLVQKGYDCFPNAIREKIYESKPGVTGIGSVIFRDEEKLMSSTDMDPQKFYDTVITPYKGACEVWYGCHRNLWVDFKLILLTFVVIISSKSNMVYTWFKGLPERTF